MKETILDYVKDYDYKGFEDEYIKFYRHILSQIMQCTLQATGLSLQEFIDKQYEIFEVTFNDEDRSISVQYTKKYFDNDFKFEALGHQVKMSFFFALKSMKSMVIALSDAVEYLKQAEVQEVINKSKIKITDIDIKDYLSKIGENGATKRHAPMKDLAIFAVNLALNYPIEKSANWIAHEITAQVIQHGRSINANLTECNAQDTIKKWINKDRNLKKLGG